MKSYDEFDDDYGGQQRKGANNTNGSSSNGRQARVRDRVAEALAALPNGSPVPGQSPRISPKPRQEPSPASGVSGAAGGIRAPRQEVTPTSGMGSGAVGIRARLQPRPMPRADSASQLAESAAPHNGLFVTPIFPQLPFTVTASSSPWAIMLEQACQTLEGVLAPLLEAVLCECTSTGLIPADQGALAPATRSPRVVNTTLVAAAAAAAAASCASSSIVPAGAPGARSSETGRNAGSDVLGPPRHSPAGSISEAPEVLQLPQPPYDAATCIDLLLRHDWLSYNKFPVTIRKRLEAASQGVVQLQKNPEGLDGSIVLATEQAMKGIVQDCLKAMGLPSLLGAGSRQFMAFVRHIRPEFESQLLYFDVLIADCTVTAQDAEVRGQAWRSKDSE